MATSVLARFMSLQPNVGAGYIPPLTRGRAHPSAEVSPAWLWGQGSPAAISPFTTVNKGSLYSEVNASDDDPNLWIKVDEGGDAADWISVGNTGIVVVKTQLFDISANDAEVVVFHAVTACEILEIGIVYNEATAASGLEGGDLTIGTASGGAEVVAAYTYTTSQASGTYIALTLVSGVLAAATSVFAHHDIASGATGTFFLQMKIRVEA